MICGGLVVVGCVIACVVAGINHGTYHSSKSKIWLDKTLTACRKAVMVAVALIVVSTLIPTSKELAAIYIIPKVVTNERVDMASKSLDGVMTLAKQWIDAQVETGAKKSQSSKE